ncbi:hypothetical protein GCM10010269_69400 [Streptomyces humidus]|uniref:Uncharacterized protein n=1 Tax=Streptomyces humidus TaxID=52259 RepID=A0A918G701_9ACTN|nr:hypothetical protein GCM10010269_69400 [Streptomyces humidus]
MPSLRYRWTGTVTRAERRHALHEVQAARQFPDRCGRLQRTGSKGSEAPFNACLMRRYASAGPCPPASRMVTWSTAAPNAPSSTTWQVSPHSAAV